jgi:large subunit ribosomal protein L19
MNLVDVVNQKYASKKAQAHPEFRTGDTLAVHVRITEGAKSRVQIFQGTCIGMRRKGALNGHFKVRKISNGIGVERVFPFHGPSIEKVEIKVKGKLRQAKAYYLRERSGKSARVKIDYDR